jgi:hypothetical protein
MVPRLLVLALEFYRAPLRFGHLTDPALPLPAAFGDWLSEALAAVTPANLPATAEALTAEPTEVEAALVFFVRQVLLLPQADHYRVLGLPRQAADGAIRQHYSLLVRMFHPDRSPGDEEQSRALTARINAAYRVLRDPEARRVYDRSLPAPPTPVDETLHFFRPGTAVIPAAKRSALRSVLPGSMRRAGLWAMAGLAVGGLLLVMTREPDPPALRINPDAGRETASRPAYLRQDSQPAWPGLINEPGEPASTGADPRPTADIPGSPNVSGPEQRDAPERPKVPVPHPADGAAEPSPRDEQKGPVIAEVVIDEPLVGSGQPAPDSAVRGTEPRRQGVARAEPGLQQSAIGVHPTLLRSRPPPGVDDPKDGKTERSP